MKNLVNKTVDLSIVGEDGDRYYLIGAFVAQAKRECWSEEDIQTVITEAQSGDYDHLLAVLDIHCSPKDGE